MAVSRHFPAHVEPMAAALAREPFHRPGWIYEEKYDGWRMLAFKDGGVVRLVSRKSVDHTTRFRDVADALARLRAPRVILDGEVCVFDAKLVSQVHLLAEPTDKVACTPPVYMAFDVLWTRGLDTRGLPLHRRRALLEEEVAGAHFVYAARRLADDGQR